MRIAVVAPLQESVPPKAYGGTERIAHYLTEELVKSGHDVTLFASGDSETSAKLVSICRESIRLSKIPRDASLLHMRHLLEVVRMADQFDIVHFHSDWFHFPLWRSISTPQVTTLHGRLDIPDLKLIYDEFPEMAVVSISNSQRCPLPRAGWVDTVYNGIPGENYTFRDDPEGHLVFLGRFTPEKGPEEAIEIAKRTGLPLKMAAKIDPLDRQYFAERIEPLLDDPLIEFIGEVDEFDKDRLLGGARALLFPIAWPEPFGLVMIEAMACGTPVIALRRGSVDETVRFGRMTPRSASLVYQGMGFRSERCRSPKDFSMPRCSTTCTGCRSSSADLSGSRATGRHCIRLPVHPRPGLRVPHSCCCNRCWD